MKKHINIKISGKVQGVGFRFCSYEKFVELELIGKAENVVDGSVSVNAEGEESRLQELIAWCKQGPVGAKVEDVVVTELAEAFVPLKMS